MCDQLVALSHVPKPTLLSWGSEILLEYELGVISTDEVWFSFCKLAGKRIDKKDFLHALCDIFEPRPEMEAWLREIKEEGYTMLLLSNTVEPHIDFLKSRFSFFPLFDHEIYSYEIGLRKPNPMFYKHALEVVGKEPQECLFFDDIEENVLAAKKLGIQAQLFISLKELTNSIP